jgi:hypothetical protein
LKGLRIAGGGATTAFWSNSSSWGIEASKQKEKAFFELADRFRASEHPDEVKRLGDELGRFVFGE